MVIKIRTVFFFFALCFLLNLPSYGQFSQHPPAPMAQDTEDYEKLGCGENGGGGNDPSVPPGLCLPIDDYLLPLLFAGVLLGAYKMRKFEQI